MDVELHALIQAKLFDARTAIKYTLHTPNVNSVRVTQQPAYTATLSALLLLDLMGFTDILKAMHSLCQSLESFELCPLQKSLCYAESGTSLSKSFV